MKASFDVTLSPKDLYRLICTRRIPGFRDGVPLRLEFLDLLWLESVFRMEKHLTPCSMQQ